MGLSSLSRSTFYLTAFLLCQLTPQRAVAQTWERVFELGDRTVTMIEFPQECGDPNIGFVAAYTQPGGGDHYCELIKTTDGGDTWRALPHKWQGVSTISSLAFADPDVGWIGIFGSNQDGGIYKTTDGGETWTPSGLDFKTISALHFNQLTQRLHASTWSTNSSFATSSYYSDDLGESWQRFGSEDLNGYAFANEREGMISSIEENYLRTMDGGISWEELDWDLEAWQPCYFPPHNAYYIASEEVQRLYRSTNFGDTWQFVYSFESNDMEITGAILTDGCALYLQGRSWDENIYVSTDGRDWDALGGPSNGYDTRFEVHGGYVYAGGPFSRYDPEPPAIFRRQVSFGTGKAQVTLEPSIETEFCKSRICTIDISQIECGGSTLINASFEDTVHFTTDGSQFPISGAQYVLDYVFTPSAPGSYITTLNLRFQNGGVTFDTTFKVRAVATAPFIPMLSTSSQSVIVGDSLEVIARVPASFAGKPAPQEVVYTLAFDDDALTVRDFTANVSWGIVDWQPVAGGAEVTVRHLTTDPVRADEPMFSIRFRSAVSTTQTPGISFSGASFDNVTLEASCLPFSDSLRVTLLDICGTPTLRDRMSGKRTLSFVELSPNPTLGSRDPMISGVISSELEQNAVLAFSDLHGRRLFQQDVQLTLGANRFSIPSLGLGDGVYFIELTTASDRDVRKVVLQ